MVLEDMRWSTRDVRAMKSVNSAEKERVHPSQQEIGVQSEKLQSYHVYELDRCLACRWLEAADIDM